MSSDGQKSTEPQTEPSSRSPHLSNDPALPTKDAETLQQDSDPKLKESQPAQTDVTSKTEDPETSPPDAEPTSPSPATDNDLIQTAQETGATEPNKLDSAAAADPHVPEITSAEKETTTKTDDNGAPRMNPTTDADPQTQKLPPVEETSSRGSDHPNNVASEIIADSVTAPEGNKTSQEEPSTAAQLCPPVHATSPVNDERPPSKQPRRSAKLWKKLRNVSSILSLGKDPWSKRSDGSPSNNDQSSSTSPEGHTSNSSPGNKDPPTSSKDICSLITADLGDIKRAAGNLNKYYEQLSSQHEKASRYFSELKNKEKEREKDIEELKNAIVKLKLKIPSRFKLDTDELDPHKKLQLDFTLKKYIPDDLLKIMPQVHNYDHFESSVEFKDFEARYNQLSTEKKLCLLCFSIFPEHAIIKKRLMVQWWVCEGFAENNEAADTFFKELIKEGFIEPVNMSKSYYSVGECRMHPFYRSVLAMLAERAKFFNFDVSGGPTQNFSGSFQACLVGDGVISYDDLHREYKEAGKAGGIVAGKAGGKEAGKAEEKQGKAGGKEAGKAEEKQGKAGGKEAGKPDLEKVLKETLERVHLIFNVKEGKLEFKPDWFSMMKNVNFMHLGSWRSTDHVEVESTEFLVNVGKMDYLKFLSLQGVANIIHLPPSISGFANLEILDLRSCHNLESIPKEIGLLTSLIHLDMSDCSLLDRMPKELCELKKLVVLKGFVVGKENRNSSCTLDDLANLTKLEKLCIYTGLHDFPTNEHVAALGKLGKLLKLTITWGVTDSIQEPVDKKGNANPQLPSELRKLDLKCFPASSNWLSFHNLATLPKLEKLYIRGGKFSDLGQYQDTDDWNLVLSKKLRWKVTQLRLKFLSEIEMEWKQLQELFPKLEFLEQVDCPKITFCPSDANGVWRKP